VTDALLALPFGLAIGLSLGFVGGGGAILAVPVLVYVVGEDVKQATTTSLLIVGATALVGAFAHARGGRVRVDLALPVGAGGALGAVAGTTLNRLASPGTILFLFAFVLLGAALAMLRHGDQRRPEQFRSSTKIWLRALPAGACVGLLTGFFGVGGGFLIVPLLVLAFGLPMKTAVGTSLLVIALTSAVALSAHVASGGLDWTLAAVFTAGGIGGVLAGSRISVHLPAARLREAFAVLVIAFAAVLVARDAASFFG
jgi:uncharacterized protein